MDFDPSAFLAMAMTEDQDTVYTAPDIPSPAKVPFSPAKMIVEGGLQLEQNMQIPIPVFGLLQQEGEGLIEEGEYEANDAAVGDPLCVNVGDIAENSSTPQHSPGERTSSPLNRKIIHTSIDETRFRKDLFGGHFEKVKIFRLHCTICDKHLGCAPWFTERQMRMHKLLNVVVCRKCFEYYGDINFPTDEGSELYCCWCGEGGECFCCSTCPKIVCKKCVKRNFGAAKLVEIDNNDDWSCFVCKPVDIWPHRALMWGMQRWSKGMRQLVAMLTKEEKQAKLSLDTSHCCLQRDQSVISVGLPSKSVLSRIPKVMFAKRYEKDIIKVILSKETDSNQNNGLSHPNNQPSHAPMNSASPMMGGVANNVSGPSPQNQLRQLLNQQHQAYQPQQTQQQQQQIQQVQHNQLVHQQHELTPTSVGRYNVKQQLVHRSSTMVNRHSPYPMNRVTNQIAFPPRIPNFQVQVPYRVRTPQYPELINVERNYSHTVKKPLVDLSSLDRGIRDVKHILLPTLTMLREFEEVRNELANDLTKLTSFSEKLSLNIKLSICNLAKANTDLVESHRKLLDNQVSSVVSKVQSGVFNKYLFVNETSTPINHNQNGHRSSPEIIELSPNSQPKTPEPSDVDGRVPSTPSTSTGEVEVAAIAMLCETVLEVGENKENKDVANKDQVTPLKKPKRVITPPVKGKSKHIVETSRKRNHSQTESNEIEIIDLTEKTKTFDVSHWCKKYSVVPCKVMLERINIPIVKK